MSETKFEIDKENLEVRIIRIFNATPERMWKAFTDPEQISVWWRNTTIDKHDFKVGGAWRFVDHGKNGDEEHAFSGEFKEIEEPNKIVRTFEYGKTLMTTVSKYENLQDLEGMVKSGMERGATAGLDRLAALVEEK
jgi:uncharacterized protein YndB with AHSA1/START domain